MSLRHKLPAEKLNNRQILLRKIASLNGEPFTLKQLSRKTRPRIDVNTVRYHIEKLVDELHVSKLPRLAAIDPQLYQWWDGVAQLEIECPEGGYASYFLRTLIHKAFTIREGNIISTEELVAMRENLITTMVEVEREFISLERMANCADLWKPSTLIERLGFRDDSSTVSD